MKYALPLLMVTLTWASDLPYRQSAFTDSAGWTAWSARNEIAPRTFVDNTYSRGEAGALAISGNSNASEHGGWERRIDGIRPGQWYRFTAWYRADGVPYEWRQILPRLEWVDAKGKRAGEPDFVFETKTEGSWKRVTAQAPAPEKAAAVKLQLYLSNAPLATVWWDDVSFEETAEPGPRRVTVASVNLRPRNTASREASVREFIAAIERGVPEKTDVILLPEGITVVGTGKKYADVAEPIPGPTTALLGELARKRNTWIAAGIYEREGNTIYNVAVLIGRDGRVAGKYRKVYLPREEVEAGITPGSTYPVFQTDFGKVGMMICYDVFYADPARALALNGAEMILMPIWGGNQVLGKARAIENRVFVISSGYDYPTYVQDPNGETLAIATEQGTAAVATIDLNKRYVQDFLGDMRPRFYRELRADVPALPH